MQFFIHLMYGLFILLGIANSVSSKNYTKDDNCPVYETSEGCPPSMKCQRTCFNPIVVCPPKCEIGVCHCIEGYIRTDYLMACIPYDGCSLMVPWPPQRKEQVCGENEVIDQCGDPCPVTCSNFNESIACPQICLPAACKCLKGYVRNFKGDCIPVELCPSPYKDGSMTRRPPACPGRYEELRPCGDPCPVTCENKDSLGACITICEEPACACIKGFVRNYNGECIPADMCPSAYGGELTKRPPACPGRYEELKQCGDPCPVTCENKDSPIPCIDICEEPTCACIKGYVRNYNGECIPADMCPSHYDEELTRRPPVCSENEVFNECGDLCPKTCTNKDDPPTCPFICLPRACVCKEGYVRNAFSECIPAESCPSPYNYRLSNLPKRFLPVCSKNEVINRCGDPCPVTCSNKDQEIPCPKICLPPACICKPGYVRSPVGVCIPADLCPSPRIPHPYSEKSSADILIKDDQGCPWFPSACDMYCSQQGLSGSCAISTCVCL